MIPAAELERRRVMLKELDVAYKRKVFNLIYRGHNYVIFAFTTKYEARTLAHSIRNTGKYTAVVKHRQKSPVYVETWLVGFRLKKGAN